MCTINYIENKDFVEVILEGNITCQSFEEIITTLNNLYPGGTLKVLQSYKNANFDISLHDVRKLVDFTNKLMKPYDFIKTASVINSPKEMALNTLYGAMMYSKHFKQRNFSGSKAALHWLLD